MGLQGLPWGTIEFPFAAGLNQGVDSRLIQAPELVRAIDVEFDDSGGLRLRKPYASIGTSIYGGGTISNCRRIYACGDELILFTSTAMYSWSSQRSAWVLKGTHLATKIEETPVFVTTGDQHQCDRAQLSGTVCYAWNDTSSNNVYLAATDADTGAVLLAPTVVVNCGSSNLGRTRLVALSTKILLFVVNSSIDLTVYVIDPAAPAVGSPTNVLTNAGGFDRYFDTEKIPGADTAIVAMRRTPNTSYQIAKVTAAAAVTSATPGRTCDGPIACACTADGTAVQIARGNGTNIQGDRITISSLADAATGQALGSGSGTINQITAAFVDSTTCHVWWTSSAATGATDWDSDYNTVTTGGVIGTAASFKRRVSLASRAFAYNGQAYAWFQFFGASSFSGASPSAFRAQLQNTYFLYRSDGFLVGKAAWQRAAGKPPDADWIGHLPGVALTSGSTVFSWCGGERRVVPLGTVQSGYSDRGPRDITFTFDSNEARRVAKLGQTLYIAGGSEVLCYDGTEIVECGFHLYPHYFGAIEVGAGNLADGLYTLKVSWRYDNKRGERERSTTATTGQVTISGGPNGISTTSWIPLYVTHKGANVVVESWRTAVNPLADSPFYLTTSQDPAITSNPNRFIQNDPTASTLPTFNDELSDASLTVLETNPENDGVLENLAPPAATLIVANDERLFLAGVPADPHRVWYSKQRADGEIAAFHDALVVNVPEPGGDITGLAFLNETLIVFRETAIYALSGAGYDNTGGGNNFESRLLSSDCGAVSQESIALTPMGLVFKSSKGWYLLDRGWQTQYIGDKVADYDSETVYAAHLVEAQHQVRIVTSGRILVFDYNEKQWAEWSVSDATHACMWNGIHHHMTTGAVKAQASTWSATDYGADVEMLIRTSGIQGFSRVRKVMVLGEYRSTCSLRVRIAYNFATSYVDDKTWTVTPTTVGGPLQLQHGPARPQCEAISIRLTSGSAGEQLKLSALSLEVGLKPGVFRHQPAAQRQ